MDGGFPLLLYRLPQPFWRSNGAYFPKNGYGTHLYHLLFAIILLGEAWFPFIKTAAADFQYVA